MEKIRGEQKNVRQLSPGSAIFIFILSVRHCSRLLGLLQGFMINAHESGSYSPGAGTFSRDLTKTRDVRDLTFSDNAF